MLRDVKCFVQQNTWNHRLIKTQIGHARDFAWYRGQRPSPARVTARDSVTRACTDSRARKPLQLRDKFATLSHAWVVIVRHLDYILITRAGDGRWPRYQVKSLACPGCAWNITISCHREQCGFTSVDEALIRSACDLHHVAEITVLLIRFNALLTYVTDITVFTGFKQRFFFPANDKNNTQYCVKAALRFNKFGRKLLKSTA